VKLPIDVFTTTEGFAFWAEAVNAARRGRRRNAQVSVFMSRF
jgi:hypothetical protein